MKCGDCKQTGFKAGKSFEAHKRWHIRWTKKGRRSFKKVVDATVVRNNNLTDLNGSTLELLRTRREVLLLEVDRIDEALKTIKSITG